MMLGLQGECRRDRIGIMDVLLYCIEVSAGIYESTRLGGQGSPGYIWQSTICISITTKYTLILPAVTAGAPQMVRLKKKPKAGD